MSWLWNWTFSGEAVGRHNTVFSTRTRRKSCSSTDPAASWTVPSVRWQTISRSRPSTATRLARSPKSTPVSSKKCLQTRILLESPVSRRSSAKIKFFSNSSTKTQQPTFFSPSRFVCQAKGHLVRSALFDRKSLNPSQKQSRICQPKLFRFFFI